MNAVVFDARRSEQKFHDASPYLFNGSQKAPQVSLIMIQRAARPACVTRRASTPAERPVEGDEGWWEGQDNAILMEPT
jgi:hypothetical protein